MCGPFKRSKSTQPRKGRQGRACRAASSAVHYTEALAAWGRNSYRFVSSESGTYSSQHRRNDHLAIIYNATELHLLDTLEFHALRSAPATGRLGDPNWHLRGALFVRLLDRKTDTEFYVGNLHLKCCMLGGKIRPHQAMLLSHWVRRADVPVILTGDFNIPIEPDEMNGNTSSIAYSRLREEIQWLRPSNPKKTQCSPDYNSMLDHFFLKGSERVTVRTVDILQTAQAYCDAEVRGGSDHRPVVATIAFAD